GTCTVAPLARTSRSTMCQWYLSASYTKAPPWKYTTATSLPPSRGRTRKTRAPATMRSSTATRRRIPRDGNAGPRSRSAAIAARIRTADPNRRSRLRMIRSASVVRWLIKLGMALGCDLRQALEPALVPLEETTAQEEPADARDESLLGLLGGDEAA